MPLPRLVVAGALLLAVGCANPDGAPSPASSVSSGIPSASSAPAVDTGRAVLELLDRVRKLPRRPFVNGYRRSAFGAPWSDAQDARDGRNGCRTRDDVLRRQLRDVELRFDDPTGCRVFSGAFTDPYTGKRFPYRGNWLRIEIDHVVPLAAAWHNGAWHWTAARRRAFANDTRDQLLAVTRAANQDKQSAGPDRWLPPRRAFHCRYALRYLRVVDRYDLAISFPEANALDQIARTRC